MINLVFFGSPAFSADLLQSLINQPKDFRVVAVVTTPDQKIGRKQILTPSPVAQLADEYHLPVYKPTTLDDNNLIHLKIHQPDMFVVAAYGKIFPKIWLDLPTLGTINVHFSLLPKYRGSLCVSEPLKNLESQTGITIMEMDEQLDHGKIIAQAALPIGLNDNTAILTKKLTQLASKVLPAVLTSYANWKKSTTNTITLDDDVCLFLPPLEQDESKAIITPSHRKRNRSTSFIPWSIIKAAITNTDPDVEALQAYLDSFAVPYSPKGLHALIRSLDPDPRAWTTVNHSGKSIDLNLIQTNFFPDTNEFQLQLVQPTGKNPMPFKQFLAGNPILES